MQDQFARQTAQHAHHRILELTRHVDRLEKQLSRRKIFENRCLLCGNQSMKRSLYCHGCSWAETP